MLLATWLIFGINTVIAIGALIAFATWRQQQRSAAAERDRERAREEAVKVVDDKKYQIGVAAALAAVGISYWLGKQESGG
jgi:hypothetical protein